MTSLNFGAGAASALASSIVSVNLKFETFSVDLNYIFIIIYQ